MESPISRTPSHTSIYAPGPHRRSHPNLQHLSLAPLTPRYPIDPADYLAYGDPSTAALHTSASISHIASLPSPGGILTNSPARSRATSRTRLGKRKVKSHVNITLPAPDVPGGAVSSAGYGHSGLRMLQQGSGSKSTMSTFSGDASWLVQTGLALTESSRENKGQSWLGKRDSSTSLIGLVTAPVSPVEERGRDFSGYGGSAVGLSVSAYVRTGRATPNRSRAGSRSRRGSRRFLAMTSMPADGAGLHERPPVRKQTEEDIQPDWADADAKAEAAANSQSLYEEYNDTVLSPTSASAADADMETETETFYDLPSEDLNDDDLDDLDDGPYDHMHFAEHFDDVLGDEVLDEEEVRREIRKTGVLGRWFDGVVEGLLMLEGEEGGEAAFFEDERGQKVRLKGEEGSEEGEAELKKRPAWDDEEVKEADVEAPPEQQQGVWGDVKWLGRLVARSIG